MQFKFFNKLNILYKDKIEGSNSLATAEYKNAINQTGWAFLDISTSQKFKDKKQASFYFFTKTWRNNSLESIYNKATLSAFDVVLKQI